MHTKHVLSFTRSIANVLRAQADLRIYVVSRDTNNKGPQNQSSPKNKKYMFRVSKAKKNLASGIDFISLVTFLETRTEEEEEEDFKLVSIFELPGVVLLPPAASQQRAFARRSCVVSSRVLKTFDTTRTKKKRDWHIAFPRR